MKVCLIYPGNFIMDTRGSNSGQQLFYLYSYLREYAPEVEVEILDLAREIGPPTPREGLGPFLAEAEVLLKRSGFDVAGISCWTTYNFPSSVIIAQLCKRLNPECQVLVGGWHPTFMPEDFTYAGSPFDYVVKGEGEQALVDIVTGKIPKEQPVQVVQGTASQLETHRLRWGESPYHRVDELVGIWLSRGCPYSCTFCADRLTNYRLLNPRDSVAELKKLVVACPRVNTVMIYDPLFGIRKDWRHEFLELLRQADLPLHYWVETRVDLFDKEDVDLLVGLPVRVDMGLESVVPEMLGIMKKSTDPEKYLQRCFELDAYMNEVKVAHTFNHIYNHPGETSRTVKQSMTFWQEYYQRAPSECYTSVSAALFHLLPGSEVFANWPDYQARYGCTILDQFWWRSLDYPMEDSSRDLIASRELAESQQLDLPQRAAHQVMNLAHSHVSLRAFRPFRIVYPPCWVTSQLMAAQGATYFDDKPLRIAPRVTLYRRVDGTVTLFNHVIHESYTCTRPGTERLDAVLGGATIGELAASLAHYPNAASRQEQLRSYFVEELIAKGYLELDLALPPPCTEAPRVRLHTGVGELEIELHPDAAPQLVANFLYLVKAHYYDGLVFTTRRPSACVEIGGLTRAGTGPGYSLPWQPTSLPTRRGAVALNRQGARLHASWLRLYRADLDEQDEAAAFGTITAGHDVLDKLLLGDCIEQTSVAQAASLPIAARS